LGLSVKEYEKGEIMIAEDKLVEIVGSSSINREQATLEAYSRDMSFVNKIKPECVVKPKNTSDIKEIVRLANETLTPLVPVSSGPPHFRGDTVPGIGGTVVVDLSGMKKIIRIDRLNRMVMFEPGVTYGELIPELAKSGLRFSLPLLPRQSKSVIGSLLEREPITMPAHHWDISDPLSCVEIVFGTGDIFRTGAAAGPGTIEEQWEAGGAQQEAAGPTQFSLYRVIQGAQGTLGIVTWVSAKCELLPKLEESFLFSSSQLDKLVEMVHWLIRLRLVNECFVLNNTNLASIMAKEFPGEYQEIKSSLPPWVLFFTIAGYEYFPEKRVNVSTKDMQAIAQRLGLEPLTAVGKTSASQFLSIVQQPCAEPYWKVRRQGACEDIFFITTNDKLQGLVDTMKSLASAADYPASEMGIYFQPIVQNANCHLEFNLFYNPDNLAEANKARELAKKATRTLMAQGAFFSRPYGENTDAIYGSHASTVEALKRVKSIFDPNNIMNPGKLCF
jgi:FAD/FMN-containing dehydrogenase